MIPVGNELAVQGRVHQNIMRRCGPGYLRMCWMDGTWICAHYVEKEMMANNTENLTGMMDEAGSLSKYLAWQTLVAARKWYRKAIRHLKKKGEDWKHLAEACPSVLEFHEDLDRAHALHIMLAGAAKLRAWIQNVQVEALHLHKKSVRIGY